MLEESRELNRYGKSLKQIRLMQCRSQRPKIDLLDYYPNLSLRFRNVNCDILTGVPLFLILHDVLT